MLMRGAVYVYRLLCVGPRATRVGLQWLHYVGTQVSVWKVSSGLMWAVRGHWAGVCVVWLTVVRYHLGSAKVVDTSEFVCVLGEVMLLCNEQCLFQWLSPATFSLVATSSWSSLLPCSHLASRRGRARRVGWRLAGPGTSTHVTGQRSAARPPRGKGWAWGPAVSPASHGKGTSSGYMKIDIRQAEAKAGPMMPCSCPSQPPSSAASTSLSWVLCPQPLDSILSTFRGRMEFSETTGKHILRQRDAWTLG